jgi:hypothetical protein
MATQSTPLSGITHFAHKEFSREEILQVYAVPVSAVDNITKSEHTQFSELSVSPAQLNLRLCTVCSEAIPAARLKAKPGADKCVPCLSAAGDVPRLRRFDENSAQGTVETLFTSDANLSHQLRRQRQTVPGYRAENAEPSFHDEYFTAAVQDADVTVAEAAEETEL